MAPSIPETSVAVAVMAVSISSASAGTSRVNTVPSPAVTARVPPVAATMSALTVVAWSSTTTSDWAITTDAPEGRPVPPTVTVEPPADALSLRTDRGALSLPQASKTSEAMTTTAPPRVARRDQVTRGMATRAGIDRTYQVDRAGPQTADRTAW